MIRYSLRRLVMMLPVLLGVSFVVFTMMFFTPGDPARIILGAEAKEADVEAKRAELGLDKPFLVQYGRYVSNIVLHGNFGTSYSTGKSVSVEIFERFPTTLLLAVLSISIAVLIGVPVGIIAATKQYSTFDNIGTLFSLIGVSMPNFWQGMVLIIAFSVKLGWFPASGFYGPSYWVLPAITVGTSSAATIMRMTRSSMLEVVRQDYIRTARAKGQSERVTILKHALANALIPVITTIGLSFGNLLGGAVLTESVFAIPGLGKLMIDSIKQKNYPMVQGGVLFMAFVLSFVNLGVDLLYASVDPRIKSQFKNSVRSRKGA